MWVYLVKMVKEKPTFNLKERIKEGLYLTELQYHVWREYKGGKTQKQIGSDLNIRQGEISAILKLVAKKIGKETVMKYRKNKKYVKLNPQDLE